MLSSAFYIDILTVFLQLTAPLVQPTVLPHQVNTYSVSGQLHLSPFTLPCTVALLGAFCMHVVSSSCSAKDVSHT